MSWPPLGHSNTILYALLMVHDTSFSNYLTIESPGNLLQVLTGSLVNAILWRLFVTFIVIRRSCGISRN
jgi:hypothetical protein